MYGVEQTPVGSGLRYSALHRSSVFYKRDWRSALRTPLTYRIGNRAVRFNYHLMIVVVCFCCLFPIIYYFHSTSLSSTRLNTNTCLKLNGNIDNSIDCLQMNQQNSVTFPFNLLPEQINMVYNSTYPLTLPITERSGAIRYRIGMIADLDTNSKHQTNGISSWRSLFKKGYLTWSGGGVDRKLPHITIDWDPNPPNVLETQFSLKERGLELSELVTFNGKLLSFDDRTGLVYELANDKVFPWIILLDGDGHSTKGFKSEWATVKDHHLYIGSMGKEWTTDSGEFQNNHPMYIKIVSMYGAIFPIDWTQNFKRLRKQSSDITWPGYMIHESVVWSSIHKKWFFMPRRCSKERSIYFILIIIHYYINFFFYN